MDPKSERMIFSPRSVPLDMIKEPDTVENHIVIDYTDTIGEGSFSVVRLAKNQKEDKIYAVKIIDKSKLDQKSLELIANETEILKMIDHPNVLKFHFAEEDVRFVHIFTEYYRAGDVSELLNRRFNSRFRGFRSDQIYVIFSQMVKAVEYLHSMGIIHRDVKLENFLYDNMTDLNVVIADFGFAMKPTDPLIEDYAGSPPYAAPEIVKGVPNEGYPSDLWSLGVCLYTMETGDYPFYSLNRSQMYEMIVSGLFNEKLIKDSDMLQLIKGLLTTEIEHRYTFEDIYQSAWWKKKSEATGR